MGNPQSFNLYAYVENNPIDFVDPSGLLEFMGPPEQQEELDWGKLIDLLLGFNYPTRGPNVGGTHGGGEEPEKPAKNPCSIRAIGADKMEEEDNGSFNENGNSRTLGLSEGKSGWYMNVEIIATFVGNLGWIFSQEKNVWSLVNGKEETAIGDDTAEEFIDREHTDKVYYTDAPGINRVQKNNNGMYIGNFKSVIQSPDNKHRCAVEWTVTIVVKNNKVVRSEFQAAMPTYNGFRIDGRR